MYCRGTPLVHNNNNDNNNRRLLRDAMFHEDWTRLMRILNRVQNRNIIAYESNDPRYLRLMNHINVLQNELVNLALVENN
jgi:adenine specific DNA methylase Mod